MDCERCRKTWALYKKEPPCHECDITELRPENVDAMRIYSLCRNQLIVVSGGMGAPVTLDISIPAVKAVMDILGIEDQKSCLLKVLKLARYDIEQERIKAMAERQA